MMLRSVQLYKVSGAIVGLFLARAVLEGSDRPWAGALVVAVGLSAASGGLVLGRWLAQRSLRFWPVLLLLGYVVWPQRDPMRVGELGEDGRPPIATVPLAAYPTYGRDGAIGRHPSDR